jgi:hypothetical protein
VCQRTDVAARLFYSRVISTALAQGADQDPEILNHHWRITMYFRTTLAATMTAIVLLAAPGCAVTRGQESVGAYVDDSTITTQVKSRFVENKQVDAVAISVETLKGTVMLSGFAKDVTEKVTAESIARGVKGVVAVKNEIAVRP